MHNKHADRNRLDFVATVPPSVPLPPEKITLETLPPDSDLKTVRQALHNEYQRQKAQGLVDKTNPKVVPIIQKPIPGRIVTMLDVRGRGPCPPVAVHDVQREAVLSTPLQPSSAESAAIDVVTFAPEDVRHAHEHASVLRKPYAVLEAVRELQVEDRDNYVEFLCAGSGPRYADVGRFSIERQRGVCYMVQLWALPTAGSGCRMPQLVHFLSFTPSLLYYEVERQIVFFGGMLRFFPILY